jgi:hypothetical protein
MLTFQVTFDAHDPAEPARLWALALGYELEPPPKGFSSWEEFARRIGLPEDRWNDLAAVVDPGRSGPRVFFQRVPEGKTAKNRVHLDVHASQGRGHDGDGWALVTSHVDKLVAAGATVLRENQDVTGRCMVLTDPGGQRILRAVSERLGCAG